MFTVSFLVLKVKRTVLIAYFRIVGIIKIITISLENKRLQIFAPTVSTFQYHIYSRTHAALCKTIHITNTLLYLELITG